MGIEESNVTWTGHGTGIVLEEYQGNYTLKGVRRYESKGETKITYDWTFPQTWDKDARTWKASDKSRPLGLFLGNKQQAVAALNSFLVALEGVPQTEEQQDIPF